MARPRSWRPGGLSERWRRRGRASCQGGHRRPERVLRLPDDADPRSERQGHAVQAAGRAWHPAWLRERAASRGVLERREVGPGPRGGSRPTPAKSTGDGLSGSSSRQLGVTHVVRGASSAHMQLTALVSCQCGGGAARRDRARGGAAASQNAQKRAAELRAMAGIWRPGRTLRLSDDDAPRSERRVHPVQAAGRAWQPAWRHECAIARGALELKVGGSGPEGGVATSPGKVDRGRLEHGLRRSGEHHARCARREKQARAACRLWQGADAAGGATAWSGADAAVADVEDG